MHPKKAHRTLLDELRAIRRQHASASQLGAIVGRVGKFRPHRRGPKPALAHRLRALTSNQVKAIRSVLQFFIDDDLANGVSHQRHQRCDVCQQDKPLPGFIEYDRHSLCNECAADYEIARARVWPLTLSQFIRHRKPSPGERIVAEEYDTMSYAQVAAGGEPPVNPEHRGATPNYNASTGQEELRRFEQDIEYYNSHRDELLSKYFDGWVAILDQEVIGAAPDASQLFNLLEERGIPPERLVVRHVTPQPEVFAMHT